MPILSTVAVNPDKKKYSDAAATTAESKPVPFNALKDYRKQRIESSSSIQKLEREAFDQLGSCISQIPKFEAAASSSSTDVAAGGSCANCYSRYVWRNISNNTTKDTRATFQIEPFTLPFGDGNWAAARQLLLKCMNTSNAPENDDPAFRMLGMLTGRLAGYLKGVGGVAGFPSHMLQSIVGHTIGPTNEMEFEPSSAEMFAVDAGGGDTFHIFIGRVCPVNTACASRKIYISTGINVFRSSGITGTGPISGSLEMQMVLTPANRSIVSIKWARPLRSMIMTNQTNNSSGCVSIEVPIPSYDGKCILAMADIKSDHSLEGHLAALFSLMPLREMEFRIQTFSPPSGLIDPLPSSEPRRRGDGTEVGIWPVCNVVPQLGGFVSAQISLLYHMHLLKMVAFVLTLDCMRLMGKFGSDDELAANIAERMAPVFASSSSSQPKRDAAQTMMPYSATWYTYLRKVMYAWHRRIGTFPFGSSKQCESVLYQHYCTQYGLEVLIEWLVFAHAQLSSSSSSSPYPVPAPGVGTRVSEAIERVVDQAVRKDPDMRVLLSTRLRRMRAKKDGYAPLNGLSDFITTDYTVNCATATLRMRLETEPISVVFDLTGLGAHIPYFNKACALFLDPDAAFNPAPSPSQFTLKPAGGAGCPPGEPFISPDIRKFKANHTKHPLPKILKRVNIYTHRASTGAAGELWAEKQNDDNKKTFDESYAAWQQLARDTPAGVAPVDDTNNKTRSIMRLPMELTGKCIEAVNILTGAQPAMTARAMV
jgi:hypothetical protein